MPASLPNYAQAGSDRGSSGSWADPASPSRPSAREPGGFARNRRHYDERFRRLAFDRGGAGWALFGSTARRDNRLDSNIDLLVVLDDKRRRISLLALVRVERQITEILGRKIDLIEEGTLKLRLRKTADIEAVVAF